MGRDQEGRNMASGRRTAMGIGNGERRRWLPGTVVAAAIVALGAAAGPAMSASSRGEVAGTTTAVSVGVVFGDGASAPAVGTVRAPAPRSRARRVREFRRMIVALYRIPGDGSAGAPDGDPIHQMWHDLAERYGSRDAAQSVDQEWYLLELDR